MGSQDFRSRKRCIMKEANHTINELDIWSNEASRVRKVVEDTDKILDDLDYAFCQKTGLNKVDMTFLFTAIGLQIIRQYIIKKVSIRLDDQVAAKSTFGKMEEHSDRKHRYYSPSLTEIISNPVPFDANIGSNGALKGGGRLGHRVTAIGHDPVLGLIFGTANIATSTLTTSSFESYHIITSNNRDTFGNHAKTSLVLQHTVDKFINQGMDGKMIIAVSLLKEIIHLRSDLKTKNSLPLPFVSAIDPVLASELANYGFDMMNVAIVGKQVGYSIFINSIIAMIHRLFFTGNTEMDKKLYEVKTRKILSYSNLVASSANLALVIATEDLSNLDLGGLAVTIYRLITDKKFIREVKEEFVFGSYKDMINGTI